MTHENSQKYPLNILQTTLTTIEILCDMEAFLFYFYSQKCQDL